MYCMNWISCGVNAFKCKTSCSVEFLYSLAVLYKLLLLNLSENSIHLSYILKNGKNSNQRIVRTSYGRFYEFIRSL